MHRSGNGKAFFTKNETFHSNRGLQKQKRLPIFQKEREDIVLEKVKQIASTTEEKIYGRFFSLSYETE